MTQPPNTGIGERSDVRFSHFRDVMLKLGFKQNTPKKRQKHFSFVHKDPDAVIITRRYRDNERVFGRDLFIQGKWLVMAGYVTEKKWKKLLYPNQLSRADLKEIIAAANEVNDRYIGGSPVSGALGAAIERLAKALWKCPIDLMRGKPKHHLEVTPNVSKRKRR